MSEQPAFDDVMSKLASVAPGTPVAAAWALRPDVIRFTQTSDDAVFRPKSEAGFSRAERAAVACRVARLLDDKSLIAHYEAMLRPLDAGGKLLASTQGTTATGTDRWSRMLAHVDRLTHSPGSSEPRHLQLLSEAGLSSQSIVALSQLIAFVNYQARVRAGLAAIAGSPGTLGGSAATLPETKPMRDFTHGELQWDPWIKPVDLDTATPEQREALKITPSNRAVGAYALVLAHDPDTVKERSPLYNAIMFGPRGLPRADRELGAVVASRINGCAYCASVHAKRFIDLAKEPEVMARLHADGVSAKLDTRRTAIVAYAAKLTSRPAALGPADAEPLRAIGLGDGEILDLTYAVAMFGWANRLMQSLGASVS
jgi:CMD domain protein